MSRGVQMVFAVAVSVASLAFSAGGGCDTGMNGLPMVPAPEPGDSVSFANHVQPILTAKCASCHRTGAFANSAGIAMLLSAGDAYGSLVNRPSSQNAALTLVVPGDSANSLLFLKVSQASPPVGSRMPLLAAPLSDAEQALIRDWIDDGALNN